MSDRLKALREERARAIADMQALTDKAQAEKRDLTAEELAKHGELFSVQDTKRKLIEAEERMLELAREKAESEGKREEEKRGNKPSSSPMATPEYRAAFSKMVAGGAASLSGDEARALSVGVGSAGGFTVVPEQLSQDLIKFTDDEVVIRDMANKIMITGAASLGVVSLDTDPADADWTSELATGNEDSAMAFGKRKLTPVPLAKMIKISNDLLRASGSGATTINIEGLVRQRLGYKFAIAQEKAFMTGSGANQPLGLFTASSDGVPTSRDYSTGNTTTAIVMDNLIGAIYQLKVPYRKRANWLFHRDAVAMIAKLKDSQNRYLWQPSLQAGQPDLLLGVPLRISEYVPNTFTTGLYVGMIADFSNYWIVDSLSMELQRLVELYAATNQTGLIGRAFVDAQPVLAEAFTRIKLG